MVNEGSFVNARGRRLFTLEVLPNSDDVRCVLVFAHAHGQHCRRTLGAFRELARVGVAVLSYDHEGQGASEPADPKRRHLVEDLSHLIDDFADYAASAAKAHRARLAHLPSFAGGVGIGGVVAALAVLRWQEEWAGLALFAPSVGAFGSVQAQLARALLAPCLDMAVPLARIAAPVVPERLCADAEAAAAFRADPLCAHGASPVRSAFQFSRARGVLERSAPLLTLPIYVEHCRGDRAERWDDSREFAASVGSEDVSWSAPEGGCHDELAGDGERARAAAGRMADWMLLKAEERRRRNKRGASAKADDAAARGGGGGGSGGVAVGAARMPAAQLRAAAASAGVPVVAPRPVAA